MDNEFLQDINTNNIDNNNNLNLKNSDARFEQELNKE